MDTKIRIHSRVEINQESIDIMRRHALQAFPNECVGFFYGTSLGKDKLVIGAKPIINSKDGDQRRRFEVDPRDYMLAERYAVENNVELLGVYHSHPLHPAIPSEHDLKQAVPFFSYIIVSVDSKQVKDITSWQLNDRQEFEREEIIYRN